VLVVVAVVILQPGHRLHRRLERASTTSRAPASARQPSDRVAIIAIDDQSIANIGRWPWPRDVHAQLIDQLAGCQGQDHRPHRILHRAANRPRPELHPQDEEPAGPQWRRGGVGEQLGKLIADAELALDTDAKLAASMTKAGNVLIPSVFVLGEPQGKPDKPLPAYALKSADGRERTASPTRPSSGQQPIESDRHRGGRHRPPQPVSTTTTAPCARSRCWSTTTARPCRRWRCWRPPRA
jgi:hypothetical protein